VKVRAMALPQPAQEMAADKGFVDSMEAFDLWDEPLSENLHAMVGRENIGTEGEPDWRWHVSVPGRQDVPRWADLVAVAHRLRPGVPFVVGVPPRSWWLNIHPRVLHLWETTDRHLVDQWRRESRGDTPT
jgi:hypothetical protein